MGEIRQTNFRVDQETADAFRKFCEENRMNQAQGFDHIMQVVEMDYAKTAVPGRATEIETFEKAVKDIMGAYLTSIEINDNAEARIREQFASSLDRKDKTIDELREKVQQLQASVDQSENARIAAENERTMAEEREMNALQQLEAAKKNSADQERINAMFSTQLAEMASKLEGYDVLKTSESNLLAKVAELEKQISDQKTAAENEIQQLKIQTELDREREVAAKEREWQEKIKIIENRMSQSGIQAELEKERAVMAKERELHEQIRQADRENAKLSAQIEQMQLQIEKLKEEQYGS